jgi:adenine deaminase
LKKGAIASSIAHDSHNIISVGTNDADMVECINWIIRNKGGIAVAGNNTAIGIPLPVAGIISDREGEWVSDQYMKIRDIAKNLGCTLKEPFMTLSFMALLVIPDLKISDKGLFDVKNFRFTPLFI